MSTLSQFTAGGNIGEMVMGGSYAHTPIMYSVDGREYVATGQTRPYDSTKHARLYSLRRDFCIHEPTTTPLMTGVPYVWGNAGGADGVFPRYVAWYKIGSTYFRAFHGSYGASIGTRTLFQSTTGISASPTATTFAGYAAYDSIKSAISGSDYIYHTYSDGTNTIIGRYNSSTLSAVQTTAFVDTYYLAASPSLIIAVRRTNQNAGSGSIYTSTNGTTWTARNGSAAGVTIVRLFWSSVISAFVMIGSTGTISTSTDGYTWTAQTAPSGMPTSVQDPNYRMSNFAASSATATLVHMGRTNRSGYSHLLKITSGPTFSLVDINANNPALWFQIGQSAGVPGIVHDGTQFVIFPTYENSSEDSTFQYYYAMDHQTPAVSTDDGSTWTIQTAKAPVTFSKDYTNSGNSPTIRQNGSFHNASYISGNEWIVEMSGQLYQTWNQQGNVGIQPYVFDNRFVGNQTPQLVGVTGQVVPAAAATGYGARSAQLYLRTA